MVERGPYVSFANCGLPYRVGGVIEHESDLLVANERVFREHFAVDSRTNCEAIGISPRRRPFSCATSRPARSRPRPTTSSCCLPGRLRSARRCRASTFRGSSRCGPCRTRGRSVNGSSGGRASSRAWAGTRASRSIRPPMRAVVVGGGFIGLEMAENLVHRGFEVTVVEIADQVLPRSTPNTRGSLTDFLELHGVNVALERRRRRLRADRGRHARGVDAVRRASRRTS